jgi:hypothetical protein
VFTEPLPSNGRLLWLHNYGFAPSCHNIHLTARGMSRYGTMRPLSDLKLDILDSHLKVMDLYTSQHEKFLRNMARSI